jgi:DNA-binding NarL/FixJ family response regulator
VAHGDREVAAATLAEALEIASRYGSKMRIPQVLDAAASLILDRDPAGFLRLTAAADQLRNALGAVRLPGAAVRTARSMEMAMRRLGIRKYRRVWAHAQTVPFDVALNDARHLVESVRTLPGASPVPRGYTLSTRERQVAELVTSGFTNRQIAGNHCSNTNGPVPTNARPAPVWSSVDGSAMNVNARTSILLRAGELVCDDQFARIRRSDVHEFSVIAELRSKCGLSQSLEVEFGVFAGEESSIMEFDAVAEEHGELQKVRRPFPLCGQPWAPGCRLPYPLQLL